MADYIQTQSGSSFDAPSTVSATPDSYGLAGLAALLVEEGDENEDSSAEASNTSLPGASLATASLAYATRE